MLPAARDSYARAVAADPNDAAMLNNHANLLLELKDPAARAQAERALKLEPNQASYAATLGWILVQEGELANGVRYLRDARLRRPENGEIRLQLAYALARSGRNAEAREELGAALSAPEPLTSTQVATALKKELGL